MMPDPPHPETQQSAELRFNPQPEQSVGAIYTPVHMGIKEEVYPIPRSKLELLKHLNSTQMTLLSIGSGLIGYVGSTIVDIVIIDPSPKENLSAIVTLLVILGGLGLGCLAWAFLCNQTRKKEIKSIVEKPAN
jgi:hypothetical protein